MEEAIAKYFDRIIATSNQMRLNKENMSDTKIVEKILRTVLLKFDRVICPIEEIQDIKSLTVEEE